MKLHPPINSFSAVHVNNVAENATAFDRKRFVVDRLEWLAILYLALPVPIFFCGWLQKPAAALGCLAFLSLLLSLKYERATIKMAWPWFVAGVGLAIVWASMGGAGHFFYANIDWYTRDAVLRDLSVLPWPVDYGQLPGGDYVLRAPIGYYLPAALLARLVGVEWADQLLFLWTAGGVALFICLTLRLFTSRIGKFLWLICLPWLAGLDAVGWLMSGFGVFKLGQHLSVWGYYFEYAPTTMLLFWDPHHALAGWLGAALLLRHWHRPTAFWIFAFLIAVTPLWSALVTVGVAPFGVAWLVTAIRNPENIFPRIDWRIVLCAVSSLIVFFLYAPWLMTDTAALSHPAAIKLNWPDKLHRMVLFDILDWGMLAALVSRSLKDVKYWTIIITLFVLPFFNFGVYNDLTNRACILPLIMLFYLTMQTLVLSIEQEDKARRNLIIVLLAVGAISPAQEFIRTFMVPHWQPDLQKNVLQVSGGYPPNYVARWEKMPAMIQELYAHPVKSGPAITVH